MALQTLSALATPASGPHSAMATALFRHRDWCSPTLVTSRIGGSTNILASLHTSPTADLLILSDEVKRGFGRLSATAMAPFVNQALILCSTISVITRDGTSISILGFSPT